MKKTNLFIGLIATLLSSRAIALASPLTIDVANNKVNIAGEIVSDQIYNDYYQLSATPNLVNMLVNGGAWTTNNIFSWTSTSGYKDALWLDNGRVVFAAPNEHIYISDNDGITWRDSANVTWLTTFGYRPLASDAQGHLYFCAVTGTPYASSYATVLRSDDGGISWIPTFANETNLGTRYPTMTVSERGDIFIGASTRGEVSNQYYAVSHDRGATWTHILPTWQAKLYATEINSQWSAYLGEGRFVFVSPYADWAGWEIMTSSDYGTTWAVNSNYVSSGKMEVPYLSPGMQGRVALCNYTSKKIYLSKDYGVTWTEIGTKSIRIFGGVNLIGSKWIACGSDNKIYYTPDDFVTLTDLGINPYTAGYCGEAGLRICERGIYTLGNYTSKTNQDFLAIRVAPSKNINPLAVPVLSASPAAYLGGLYTDGVTYYRCTNGATWTEF